MNALYLSMLASLLTASACLGEILPIKEMRFSVNLGDGQGDPQNGGKKSFGAMMDVTNSSWDDEVLCNTKFLHYGLADSRVLRDPDITALFDASEAASKQQALSKSVVNPRAALRTRGCPARPPSDSPSRRSTERRSSPAQASARRPSCADPGGAR